MVTRAQKRSAAGRTDIFSNADILQLVLSYVHGQWFFLAAVSSLWRSVYAKLDASEMHTFSKIVITCVPQMTLHSSVLASPSRLRLAHESGVDWTRHDFQTAAGRHASVATLLEARELGMQYPVPLMVGAATCNTLHVLQFLHAEGCPWDRTVTEAAARRGDVEMLSWLRAQGCDWVPLLALRAAAHSGSVEMTAWVKQHSGAAYDESNLYEAASKGHTALVEYLQAQQCPWNDAACFVAALHNHMDTLRWLHEHGCAWVADDVCEAAGRSGSIEIMIYLQQQGIIFRPAILTLMLRGAGAYSMLAGAQCLRQQGAEWPARLQYANIRWSGETLAWARAEGCTSRT
jgi:hypothetical protein